MPGRLFLQCLGPVRLFAPGGEPFSFKTRKSLALIGFLLRRPGFSATRSEIAALLWSEGDRNRATVSLRQAVSHVRQAEAACGVPLIEATPTGISLLGESLTTDLDLLQQLLAGQVPFDADRLARLWGGDFLSGFDAIDPAFAEWLGLEQERVRSSVIEKAVTALEALRRVTDASAAMQREVIAGFLVSLDPANEFAHQTLIRHFLDQGRRERAMQQLRDCTRELRNLLDEEPDPATLQLLEQPARAGQAVPHLARLVPPADLSAEASPVTASAAPIPSGQSMADSMVDLPALRRDITLPVLSIASLSFEREADHVALSLRDDIVAGLSAYRCFELFEAAYWMGEDGTAPMRVDGGELGSFLLRFRRDRMLNRIYVQLENRSSGQIAFNEVIDLTLARSRSERIEAVYRTVSRVYGHIIGRLRQRPGRSAFSRWCQAEALIWEFNLASDRKALQILSELEQSHDNFSLIYAGRCSILMKQALCYPYPGIGSLDQDEVLTLAEKAVALDPWQVVNHRMNGWTLIQSGRADDAGRAFKQALALNPLDPMNTISAAEALAHIGDIGKATELALRAFEGLATTPRIVYGYMANIFFASGDFDRAADYSRRGPIDNIHVLATRLAAQHGAGLTEEAAATRSMLLQRIGTQFGRLDPSAHSAELTAWLEQVNMFQAPAIRATFNAALDTLRETLGLRRL
ncbi:BTAD domain-containing putative transcriptional regulator [Pannonibacter sp.]|uniref:BTAD domain-containing putative transcriptional regulator n=1 Tax=Pannonibacter sp. TaxID=1906786 RepID=UPI003F72376F